MAGWHVSFAFSGGGTWRFYELDGVSVPLAEIKQAAAWVAEEEGAIARALFVEAIRAKLKAAERGALTPPDDVKTDLVRATGLHELRWQIEDRQWRMYYCEPLRRHQQRIMLSLLFNEKTTADLQDRDIDGAVTRYTWWAEDHPS
ncbi:hypothetical protein [Actinophytocola sediminis]